MTTGKEAVAGFTIIEVLLFLAISSLMIVVAMTSIAGRTRQVQFTDAIRSTEAFFDRRISQILDGSVAGQDIPCRWNSTTKTYLAGASDGSCIFLGYMFRNAPSDPSTIEVYQVFGGRLPSNDPCFDTGEILECVTPRLAPVSPSSATPVPVETYQIPWQVEINDRFSSFSPIEYFGYLRNPIGQNLVGVNFHSSQNGRINDPTAYNPSEPLTQIGDEFSMRLCFTNQSRVAHMGLGVWEDQNSVETDFDDGLASSCTP